MYISSRYASTPLSYVMLCFGLKPRIRKSSTALDPKLINPSGQLYLMDPDRVTAPGVPSRVDSKYGSHSQL